MHKVEAAIEYFQFDNLNKYSDICSHGIFTRHGGVSDAPFDTLNIRYTIGDEDEAVSENRIRVAQSLSAQYLVSADQTHSKNVQVIPSNSPLTEHDELADTDALISNTPGYFLMVQVADCQPILLLDPVKKAVGCIHSGWKGTVKNIVAATIDAMSESFDTNPEDLIAAVGPSLGTCCSEFQNRHEEFPDEFEKFFIMDDYVDLEGITKYQMIKKGIKSENIAYSGLCTKCNSDNFFSYRANQETGRFGVVIGLR